ncbi:P-loop containing nucleoside triphosphate hydrolase protein [Macrolepiota fuliginosa MF-IS2]|uniref:DNA 3'-5' helicase n=1 Tax=Macrolepiota fuliginosa MF-IS2 TaxID=1400762 RepID=A0A9P5WVT7_9AGAR|nr:P-loop containing nucleoside triphosphate hydrolase protein [Macrolepiota fuliginosa MF-IS2]
MSEDEIEQYAVSAMRRMLNKHVDWTSGGQRDAVIASLRAERDIVAILPTGSGKSMIPAVPLSLMPQTIAYIICPLISLAHDWIRRLRVWHIPSQYIEDEATPFSSIARAIVVTTDIAIRQRFRHHMLEKSMNCPRGQIILDEGHYIRTTQEYRECMREQWSIRCLPYQFIVLSATIPPPMLEGIKHDLMLSTTALVVREPSNRPELRYVIRSAIESSQNRLTEVANICKAEIRSFMPEDRGLIFVSRISDGASISKALGYDFYHAQLEKEGRKKAMERWVAGGKHAIMVCTSAIAAGVDYGACQFTVHSGTPFNMVDFVQQCGRAGRDGKEARCYIIPDRSTMPILARNDGDESGRAALYSALFCSSSCFRKSSVSAVHLG